MRAERLPSKEREDELLRTRLLSGWGRVPVVLARERRSEDLDSITRDAVLSRGLGRSYGDASLPHVGPNHGPPPIVANTARADRILSFDPDTGVVRAEAGLSLGELHRIVAPRGWYAPVVPGTQYVTLGGMVASDVHGKNHHRAGTFGEHVLSLRLRVGDGRILEVSAEGEPELFRATLGGMGLTGHVLEVEFALTHTPSRWIYEETERFGSLDEVVAALRDASRTWPFTMAWVDTVSRGRALGRGIVRRGRWAEPSEAPAKAPRPKRRIGVPFTLPISPLNPLSMRAFNTAVFRLRSGRARARIRHPEPFFYPLDFVRDWHRLYGPRGMVQYQCVLPSGLEALRDVLGILHERRAASFITVLKDFGSEGRGAISFPRPGLSLNLDLPMRGDATRGLVDALNERVIADGGRVYLAKDALTQAPHFRRMEPRLAHFAEVRRKWDPEGRLESALSHRLFGDEKPLGDGA